MTTIAAATDGKTHAVAADGRMVFGDFQISGERTVKILPLENGDLVAMAGSGKGSMAIERIRFCDEINVHAFTDALEASLKQLGFTAEEGEGGPGLYTLNLIYVSTDGIWSIASDMFPIRVSSYAAHGTGGHFALGAVASLMTAGVGPIPSVAKAIAIAGHLDVNTGPNVMIASRGEVSLDPIWVDEYGEIDAD